MADLFPDQEKAEPFRPAVTVARSRPEVRTETEYVYHDETGRPLFMVRVVRHPDGKKRVTQHAVRDDGGWAANLGKARRVLYRLPYVVRAMEALAPVFIVEGEKCADAVAGLGLVATTNPAGAGKWQKEYSEALRGATVYVVPDNDEPGRQHAADVAAALTGVASSVQIIDLPGLPDKGDIADWLAAGNGRDDLLALLPTVGRTASHTAIQPGGQVFPAPSGLADAARIGVIGEALDILDGTTEAEPAAILAHLLIGFGTMVGPRPYVRAGNERQRAKTFAVVVGDTAIARKGTAWGDAKVILSRADEEFLARHHVTGLSTGEGLIFRLRDPEQATLDEGADIGPLRDPRLLVVEPEWAKLLRLDQRQGNTLSAVVREAWDNGPLGTLTKTDNGMQASLHHIGIVGHITTEELRAELTTVAGANGFANRHLLMHVTRSKWLPDPAPINETRLGMVGLALLHAARNAADRGEVTRTPAANEMWQDLYRDLDTATHAGIAGHWLARGPAQVLRLALLYALADEALSIDIAHLEAAAAVWDYHRASVLHVFGGRLGDPIAERLLAAVRAAGSAGLDGRGQHAALDNNASKEELAAVVARLTAAGLVDVRTAPSGPNGGRRRTILVAR